jgi:hypothetical protein
MLVQPFHLFSKREPIDGDLPERFPEALLLCALGALLRFNSAPTIIPCP